MARLIDLTGMTFERLTVLYRTDDHIYDSGRREAVYHCLCSCGKEIDVMGTALRRGYSKSCGCLRSELARQTVRNETSRHLRIVWRNMVSRCCNQDDKRYNRYGGRGIALCEEWSGQDGMEAFIQWAIENGYTEGLTIDRIDNDSNYSPQNCRWVSKREQSNNRSNNRYIIVDGMRKTVAQWAEQFGLKIPWIYDRTDDEIASIIQEKMK